MTAALRSITSKLRAPKIGVAGRQISPEVLRPWAQAKDGYQLWIVLSNEQVIAISEASEFSLLTEGSNHPGFDRETTFGTVGLKNYLAATQKN